MSGMLIILCLDPSHEALPRVFVKSYVTKYIHSHKIISYAVRTKPNLVAYYQHPPNVKIVIIMVLNKSEK